jgi:hypothetical protein
VCAGKVISQQGIPQVETFQAQMHSLLFRKATFPEKDKNLR